MEERRRAESLVGSKIAGRFLLRRVLGVGGMGAVYEALDSWTERRVALKRLHPDEARDERADERFFREARVVAKLDHPHIVRLFDLGRAEDGSLFLVQELLEGSDLRKHLRAGPMSERQTLEVVFAACDAVAHAHEMGVVHRDLKPENIFVQRAKSGRLVAKVIDFGIARAVARDPRLTPTGHVFGTPSYMAPEQADGHSAVTPSWDTWALAIIAFECLTGKNPFARDNVLATLSALLKDPAPAVASLRGDVRPALAAVIDRALSRTPSERFADAYALRDALYATGLLDEEPWAKALLDRSRDAIATDVDRASLERIAGDGAMQTAPLGATAQTEPPRSQPTHRTAEQSVETNTAIAKDIAEDELEALGLRRRSRRSLATLSTLGAAGAATLWLLWPRTEAPRSTAMERPRTARATVAPAIAPNAAPATQPVTNAASPTHRATSAAQPPPAATSAQRSARRTIAVQPGPSGPTTLPSAAQPSPARPSSAEPATSSSATIDHDETSTPIRRYP